MIKLFKYLFKLLFSRFIITEIVPTETIRPRKRKLTSYEREIKINRAKGLSLFEYPDGISVWALNKNSADRKYRNLKRNE